MSMLSRHRRLVVAVAVVACLAAVAGVLGFRFTHPPQPSLAVAAGLDVRCTLPVRDGGHLATVSLPDGTLENASEKTGPHDLGETYARGRWLPVEAWTLSPDGGSYAYVTWTTGTLDGGSSALFVHDVDSGRDRAVWSGAGQAEVMGWAAGGVYLNRVSGTGHVDEVWVVDPARPSAAHAIGPNPPLAPPLPPGGQPFFTGIAGGAAWAESSQDGLTRMDLRTGAVAGWYRAPAGMTLALIAIDRDGRPLVGLSRGFNQPVAQLVTVTGRDRSAPVATPDPNLAPESVLTDAHGTWLAGAGFLWLYRNGRVEKVADVPGHQLLTPVGPCA
jgi:hypothetical protein